MKKKGIVRFYSAMLAGAMSICALTGCGGQEEKPADASGAADKQQEASQESKTSVAEAAVNKNDPGVTAAGNGIVLPELPDGVLRLEVGTSDFDHDVSETLVQKEWEKAMEAYLGCEIEITWSKAPWKDFQEKEMVVLQSGMVPDVSTLSKGAAVNEFGEDGLLLNLSDYMDYMVYYPDYMADTNGGERFAQNEDGSMYYFMNGFYNADNIEGAQSFTSFAYRFDILKENGWQPAATLEEFTQLCADMQAAIDAGTVELDYVIMNSTKDYALYRGFVGIFHTWDCLYYNGNEWVFGPIEDNFREMLKYLNGLYEAGYIDPEFATADSNLANTKATTGVAGICPTLWSGSVSNWNIAKTDEAMEWGLAYLPEGDYGTAWKWGSRQGGKSLESQMGIYISAETEHPEYVVAMIDYQYSDYMVDLLNWGVEGQTYNVVDGERVFIDDIMKAEEPDTPALKTVDYGIMSASVCRTGIPVTPLDFKPMLILSSLPEPWWNPTEGYYEGKYWEETNKNGGPDSVAPYDRPPVTYLSAEEQSEKAQLSYSGTCENRVKELAHQFIIGERDIEDDAAWADYIEDVKSQTDGDFDSILQMLNEKTVK